MKKRDLPGFKDETKGTFPLPPEWGVGIRRPPPTPHPGLPKTRWVRGRNRRSVGATGPFRHLPHTGTTKLRCPVAVLVETNK